MKPWFRELPGSYTNYLRRTLGDPTVTLAWAPDFQRKTYKRNKPVDMATTVTDTFGLETFRGCFVMLKWVRRAWVTMDDQGHAIHHSTREPYIEHVFDGEAGEPVIPHRNFIVACLDTDKCRWGPERERKNDRMRKAKVLRAKADRDRIAKEGAGNMEFYRALRSYGEEFGVGTPDKDEMYAMEKQAFKEGARIEAEDNIDIKGVQVHVDRSDEELL